MHSRKDRAGPPHSAALPTLKSLPGTAELVAGYNLILIRNHFNFEKLNNV